MAAKKKMSKYLGFNFGLFSFPVTTLVNNIKSKSNNTLQITMIKWISSWKCHLAHYKLYIQK